MPNDLLLMLVTNSTCIKKKKKSLLISNVNNNLGNSAAGGTCYEPTCHFQYWQCKIQEDLKTPQKPPYEQKVEYSKK